jgi:threonine synthase
VGAILSLTCVDCGREHAERETLYTCVACGGNLDVRYDIASIRASWPREALARDQGRGIWRWLPLLPVAARPPIPLVVGDTPLVALPRLAAALGVAALHVKDDGRNPSASLKDRASAVAVARAREAGVARVTCASTGNAASSLATLAASVGLETVIFVPEAIPRPKLAQLLLHGARVVLVRGNYDAAYDLCLAATARFGWYSRNTGFNPYLAEGKKTVGLEIAEALAWRAPDRVFVSVGDGCILAGVHKAFADLLALGWIDRVPRLVGVQAEGAAPLAAAHRAGARRAAEVRETIPRTFADSVAVGKPRDATKALRAARETDGDLIVVTDDEIRGAMRRLAAEGGIFAEPAGATGFAGLARMAREGRVARGERVAVLVTGSGLKDIESAIRLVEPPEPVDADLDAVAAQLGVEASR